MHVVIFQIQNEICGKRERGVVLLRWAPTQRWKLLSRRDAEQRRDRSAKKDRTRWLQHIHIFCYMLDFCHVKLFVHIIEGTSKWYTRRNKVWITIDP